MSVLRNTDLGQVHRFHAKMKAVQLVKARGEDGRREENLGIKNSVPQQLDASMAGRGVGV